MHVAVTHTIDTELSSSLLLFFILSIHFSGDVLRYTRVYGSPKTILKN